MSGPEKLTREGALSLLVEAMAGRIRSVRDRLRAMDQPATHELAQELEDVLPAHERDAAG